MDFAKVLAAAEEVQAIVRSRGWRFCFIGGIAVQRWGAPRFTQDVDLTLLTGFGEEERFVDGLLEELRPRRTGAREFALIRRVLLVETTTGISVDIALGAFPFEEHSIERASAWEFAPQRMLLTCSAEDLLIHKAFAGRDRDWADAETILVRQHGALDLTLVRNELRPLLDLKGEPESLEKFNRMANAVSDRLRR